jgi:hypothetical protein
MRMNAAARFVSLFPKRSVIVGLLIESTNGFMFSLRPDISSSKALISSIEKDEIEEFTLIMSNMTGPIVSTSSNVVSCTCIFF